MMRSHWSLLLYGVTLPPRVVRAVFDFLELEPVSGLVTYKVDLVSCWPVFDLMFFTLCSLPLCSFVHLSRFAYGSEDRRRAGDGLGQQTLRRGATESSRSVVTFSIWSANSSTVYTGLVKVTTHEATIRTQICRQLWCSKPMNRLWCLLLSKF